MSQDKQALILLVDDRPDNLDVLLAHLDKEAFSISVALSGQEGLDLARECPPDLILLDVSMPGMDGFETCRRLKQVEATKDTPVLFMTALNDTDSKLKGFQAGGVDYLSKPLQYEEMLARINIHLTLRRQQKDLEAKNAELEEKNALISEQAERLEVMARTDPLTQLANRRGFLEQAAYEQTRCERSGDSFALIMADIDHFKQINDSYGHDCGDEVLAQAAAALRSLLRREDIPARWGGEEFIILLPEDALDSVMEVAERIRGHFETLDIPYKNNILRITLSFGIALCYPGSSLKICIEEADEALYRAKAGGRNRVEA